MHARQARGARAGPGRQVRVVLRGDVLLEDRGPLLVRGPRPLLPAPLHLRHRRRRRRRRCCCCCGGGVAFQAAGAPTERVRTRAYWRRARPAVSSGALATGGHFPPAPRLLLSSSTPSRSALRHRRRLARPGAACTPATPRTSRLRRPYGRGLLRICVQRLPEPPSIIPHASVPSEASGASRRRPDQARGRPAPARSGSTRLVRVGHRAVLIAGAGILGRLLGPRAVRPPPPSSLPPRPCVRSGGGGGE